MSKFKLLSVSVVVLLLAGSTVVLATPNTIQAPPWPIDQWSTTTQWWEFGPDNNGAGDPSHAPGSGVKPDGPGPLIEGQPGDPYLDPGYLPSTELWIEFFSPWIEEDPSGRTGIWPLSGIIDVVVDNHNPPNEKKIVWVQIIWAERIPGEHPDVPIVTPVNQAGHLTTTPELVGGVHEDLGDGWYESTYTWEIYPNPVDEWFTIGGDIRVDALIIDTWCVPEPATLGLLLIGGLVLLRRRHAEL